MEAAIGAVSITAKLLVCGASLDIIAGEGGRLGALRHVCLALPRMAQALHEQVRQLWPG